MRQEVYTDVRPLADYDGDGAQRVFVHLCSAAQWTAITGEVPSDSGRPRRLRQRRPAMVRLLRRRCPGPGAFADPGEGR